jgi:hypothetical protein
VGTSLFVFLFCFLHVGSNPVPKMADVTYFRLSRTIPQKA